MKVRVSVTLDVDPASYETEYGVPKDQIRADLQQHVQQSVHAH
ncbi:Uncharacterised protein [Mycobacteroides abscessus subsp. abscessus]|nr:Uncharacterised protein [Mycobacteroides abscessus subsp. abscessus]